MPVWTDRVRLGALALVAAAAAAETSAARQLPGFQQGTPGERVEIQTPQGTVHGLRTEVPHAVLLTYATPAKPARKMTLVVEITPDPETHVYAKGATGYQPVTLSVKAAAGVRLEGTPAYPPPVLHRFEALDEIVPVYEQAFLISQDVLLPAAGGAGGTGAPLRMEGELVYQACTDTICYEAERVPLGWTIPQP